MTANRSEPAYRITQALISAEWNKVAGARERQLASHTDVSYEHVLTPQILDFIKGEGRDAALDAGCGLGFLAERLAAKFGRVVGVDLSSESIQRAELRTKGISNLKYIHSSVEKYSRSVAPKAFDVAIANMTLQTATRLPAFLRAIRSVLVSRGVLAITVPHPCFWPRYWNYEREPWFRYDRETAVRHPFRISGAKALGVTTHIHRPLETYMAELVRAGFSIESIREPMPSAGVTRFYDEAWKYPRFLALKARYLLPGKN